MSGLTLRQSRIRLSEAGKIWSEIWSEIENPNPFLSFDWFEVLVFNILKIDPEAFIFYDGNRPVGLLLARIEADIIKLFGDEQITDFNGLLYLPGYEDGIVRVLHRHLQKFRLDFFPLLDEDPLVRFLPVYLRDVTIEDCDPCPVITLPPDWDGYLKLLTGRDRHELRRKLKRGANLRLRPAQPDEVAILFEHMARSDEEKERFLTPEIKAFFKDIASRFEKKGWLRYRILNLGKRPIGSIFSFQIQNRVYVYNMGFDPGYQGLSPGIVMIAHDIRAAISEGFCSYDFLRGDEGYKLKLGAKIRWTKRLRR